MAPSLRLTRLYTALSARLHTARPDAFVSIVLVTPALDPKHCALDFVLAATIYGNMEASLERNVSCAARLATSFLSSVKMLPSMGNLYPALDEVA